MAESDARCGWPRLNLLDLPAELRHRIWTYALSDAFSEPDDFCHFVPYTKGDTA